MKFLLDTHLIQYLQEQRYEYWLAKAEYVQGESGAYSVSLIPVHKQACKTLPPGYAYFKIRNKETEIIPGSSDSEITVHLMENDVLLYKKFLIKVLDTGNSVHQ